MTSARISRARNLRRLAPVLCGALGLTSCAGGYGEDGEVGPVDEYQMATPTLGSIAPSEIVLGDRVNVFGSGFVPEEHGSLSLVLDGVFADSDGDEHEFSGEIALDVANESVASFSFEEIFFHPRRNEIGAFSGTASLVNRAPSRDDIREMDELWSEQQMTSLRVLPSIRITRLRSVDAEDCALVTGSTNGDHNIELGIEAIGIGKPSKEQPWTVRLGFLSPEVNVFYVTPDLFRGSAVDVWPLNSLDGNETIVSPAAEGDHRIEFEVDDSPAVVLNPQWTARTVKVSPPATIGDKVFSEVLLGKLAAGGVEFGGRSSANFVLEMITADGATTRRVVTMDVWDEFEIGQWDGEEMLAERYEAHATSGCITCSPNGPLCTVEYSEGETLTRSRSVNIRWDTSVAQMLGFSAGNFNRIQINGSQSWTNSFGVEVNESVSSEQHKNKSTSVQVIPSYAAMSYRQLERRVRSVDVVYHNACGASGVVGQAELTNWNFGFEVATGPECSPPTNLPPPEKRD